jgi:class 3 adenylate cyclase
VLFRSLKKYFLVVAVALAAAFLTVLLLNYLLAGPKLAFYYDFLLQRRPDFPLPREILLVDSEEITEPGTVVAVLDAMTEFDAECLVIETPILGFSPIKSGDVEEIRRHFDEEFTLLGSNIRNLFEAIKTGSVSPLESGRYVEELVALTERGKERLSAAVIRPDTASIQLERASEAFGRVLRAGDLRALPMDTPWYSKVPADGDGKIRRISPVLPSGEFRPGADGIEHILYAALKERWDSSVLEYGEYGPVLINTVDGRETIMALDKNAAILVERPGRGNFRRIPVSIFVSYDEADRLLERRLREAEGLGVYAATAPERSPVYIADYGNVLREDLLDAPSPERRSAWKEARKEYFKSLEEFLSGPFETVLVSGYEELIATERLDEKGQARLAALRDELIRCFAELREAHAELIELRGTLEEALSSSLCILGPGSGAYGEPSITETSAMLAGALLGGRAIVPGETRHILWWSFFTALFVTFAVSRMKPLMCLLSGLFLSAAAFFGFSWYFVISAYWIDPLIPAAASLAGILTLSFGFLLILRRGAGAFRAAYGNAAGKQCLKQLIRAGRPRPGERNITTAAVIAVKDPSLLILEDEDCVRAAGAAEKFRGTASELFKKAGAVILGCEGDMILACFGSPLERISLSLIKGETPYADDFSARGGQNPASKAGGFIAELALRHPETESWRFGIDCGDCLFFWSRRSGYTAAGSPVVRSRILAGLAPRYKARILVTEPVRERLSMPVRKLHTLEGKNGGGREAFYELLVKPPV